jgi:hypothetical protein
MHAHIPAYLRLVPAPQSAGEAYTYARGGLPWQSEI